MPRQAFPQKAYTRGGENVPGSPPLFLPFFTWVSRLERVSSVVEASLGLSKLLAGRIGKQKPLEVEGRPITYARIHATPLPVTCSFRYCAKLFRLFVRTYHGNSAKAMAA